MLWSGFQHEFGNDGAKYIVSGDSISKGVIYDEVRNKYVILEDNYVSLLQNKLKGAVRNTARFGNTLLKGISNLKRDVMKEKPNIVLIEYGGNDCDYNWNEIAKDPGREHHPKTDFHTFEKVLMETVNDLKSQQIIPILMSLPPLNADNYFKWVTQNDPEAAKRPGMARQRHENLLAAGALQFDDSQSVRADQNKIDRRARRISPAT
ncbi:SGNH/GDSL hydrolase family protein [Paenibacillus sp. JTLBN-2024]